MTNEEVKKILDENFTSQAMNEERFECQYLTSDGRKCAIGCFIPDGHKGRYYEGNVADLLEDYPDLKENMPPLNELGLSVFQNFHDAELTHIPEEDQKDALFNEYLRLRKDERYVNKN